MTEPISKKMKLLINDDEKSSDSQINGEKVNIIQPEEKMDESEFPFPDNYDASTMLCGVDLSTPWPSVTDRYFTSFYKIDVQKPGDDVCIRVHSNRICMISLAPSHVILHNNSSSIVNVNFRVSEKLDRMKNQVSGKGKRGAQPLQENSTICTITLSNGENHVIKCCMTGKLVEVNESLAKDPSLLLEPPHKGGYLAIVLPNIRLIDDLKKKLLTQESYNSALEERQVKMKLEKMQENNVSEIEV
ncbi:protein Abitram [Leptopilina heterotoma]|uniref:protein Abitram n=1 Tax=Leptopilina heterotoma TaxID=63436 RepID=UPI001CA9D8CA|nr:protein Abitram [Leptopilina heterotoma]